MFGEFYLEIFWHFHNFYTLQWCNYCVTSEQKRKCPLSEITAHRNQKIEQNKNTRSSILETIQYQSFSHL
jgi:hypothetical protein